MTSPRQIDPGTPKAVHPMTTAAIYARRSTDAQAASLERQVAECERYAEGEGWRLGET